MDRERIIWGYVQQIIKKKITNPGLEAWLMDTRLEELRDLEAKFVVSVSTSDMRDVLETCCKQAIEEGFRTVTKLKYQAEFVVRID